jgi:hypothetical protein
VLTEQDSFLPMLTKIGRVDAVAVKLCRQSRMGRFAHRAVA